MRWFYLTAKHKFTLIILFGLATLYFNYRAIDRLSSQPEYKSKCDFKMAKYVIESLVNLFNFFLSCYHSHESVFHF